MLHECGVASKQQVLSVFPDHKDLGNFKAIIECYDEIPCNPCEKYCPFDAIEIGTNINKRPQLIVDKCVGCGVCVGVCPGLAILLAKLDSDKCVFTIPYELSPLPVQDEVWEAVNRAGEVIGLVKIIRVVESSFKNKTYLVTVETERAFLHEFVTIGAKVHE